MTETISFPGLGLDFEINRVAFYLPEFLGRWPIYWYGILIALGLLGGILYFFARTKEFAVDPDRATDVLLVSIVFGVIGARLYYVIFSWDEFRDSLIDVFNVRKGGLAIYGCIIFAVLTAIVMCRLRKVKFLPVMDLASASLLLGQAVGRWGNFINSEAFGSNTTAPWGMTSPTIAAYLAANQQRLEAIGVTVDPSLPVHPTFLYESLWCIIGFAGIALLTKRRRFDGQLTLMYLGWYGLGRFMIEGLRTDPLLIGTIRVSQLFALLCFLACTVIILAVFSRIRREGDPNYLQLYRDSEEGKLVLAGEFYKKKDKAADEAPAKASGDTPDPGEEDPAGEEAAADTAEEPASSADGEDDNGAAD